MKANKIPILTFHRVVEEEIKENNFKYKEWINSLQDFEKELQYLKDNDYKTISCEEFYKWYTGKIDFDKKTVMLTFDDGDYTLYYLVYPLLKKYNFKGVAFVIGALTEETTKEYKKNIEGYRIGLDKIKEITNDYPNLEFQSHTYDMHKKENNICVIELRLQEEIDEDFSKMNETLKCDYFAYPFGCESDYFYKALKNNQFKLAFGFETKDYARRSDYKYSIHRVKITGLEDNYEVFLKWLRGIE